MQCFTEISRGAVTWIHTPLFHRCSPVLLFLCNEMSMVPLIPVLCVNQDPPPAQGGGPQHPPPLDRGQSFLFDLCFYWSVVKRGGPENAGATFFFKTGKQKHGKICLGTPPPFLGLDCFARIFFYIFLSKNCPEFSVNFRHIHNQAQPLLYSFLYY